MNKLINRFKELYERIRSGSYTSDDLDEAIKIGRELVKKHENDGDVVGSILMRIIVWSLESMKYNR